jgi:hypothetical protein
MPFLSISLDVVGSTALKKRLAEFSSLNKTNLDEHYRDLLRSMLVSMNCFLELVSVDSVLDIHRLTLIKRIGDEFWYMYDLNGLEAEEVAKHATHMVQAMLAFLLDAHFDVTAFLPNTHIREELFWKCTIDSINHAVDSSKLAEDELDQFIQRNSHKYAMTEPGKLLALRNQLGVGVGHLDADKAIFVSKSDFIGLEIDRFFRISRAAEQGKILAGRNFIFLLQVHKSKVSGKYSFNKQPEADSSKSMLPEFSVVLTEFTEEKLKGIKEGYSGAYIFNDYLERADYEGYWDIKGLENPD